MNKNKKQSESPERRIPLWLQIVIILLCGATLSAATFFIIKGIKAPEKQSESNEDYTVKFAYQDGTVIGEKTVQSGKGVFPPIPEGVDVFRGWSGAVNNVESDIEVHPLFYEITDDGNLFYFNSVYVQEGEQFTLDLYLSGKVNISSAELTILYDTEVMEYVGTESTDICNETEHNSGEIKLMLNSNSPLKAKTELAQITFKAKKKDVYATEIELGCKHAVLKEAGKETPVTASTINNKIYYLQEVGE